MIIKNENFAVYTSTESKGNDVIIKDSLDRKFILDFEDLNDLIESLCKLGLSRRGDASVRTPFREL